MKDLICNRNLREWKGAENEQHVIRDKVKCGERERVDEEVKRAYRLWSKYREVNLRFWALSRGVGLAISF